MTAILVRQSELQSADAVRASAQEAALRPARTRRGSVLLLGNYRPALWVARALAAQGLDIVAGRGGGEGCTEYSKHVSEVWDHPDLEQSPQRFMAALNAFLRERADIDIVYPVAEAFVTALAQHAKQLPKQVTLASVEPGVVAKCQDKVTMLRLAETTGVALEPFRVAERHDALIEGSRAIGFPVVIRPLRLGVRFGHKKALICNSEADLRAALPDWPASQGALLIQRQARGVRHNVFFAAQNGRLVRTVETKILRTDHVDGTGLAVEGATVAPSRALHDDTARLTAALGYTGVGLAQFIVDPETGAHCFIELNPRIAGSHAITEQVGAGLSHLAIDLARGRSLSRRDSTFSYPPKRRYAWTYGDLRGLKSALAEGEIGPWQALAWGVRIAVTGLRGPLHMTWDWRDPLPTLMLFARLLFGPRFSSPKLSAPLAQEVA